MEAMNITQQTGGLMMRPMRRNRELTAADYVEMRDEIMTEIAEKSYGILLADKRYRFEIDYPFADEEKVLHLSGYADIEIFEDRGDAWTPGGYRKYAELHLDKWVCKTIEQSCSLSDFEEWADAETDFDPTEIDGYQYDIE